MGLSNEKNLGASEYLDMLLVGERLASRQLIETMIAAGTDAAQLLNELIWPVMEQIQSLYRDDKITLASLNLATRLNRSLADQLTAKLPRRERNGKTALIFCGDDEPEELGGQICADLFEAQGWNVRFAGGGVPNDEVLRMIGEERPQLVIMFATLPSNVPAVRKLIDYLREVNSCPEMQIMCCGGIYKRAEGLAEEIGADLYAPDATEAVRIAEKNPNKRASLDQQTVGRTRRIKKAAANRRISPNERQRIEIARVA
ncbi:MAG TPA: cobalamin-dependent protein [Tepidisphaeraceae bacterium]|nr:cobalamin-dependent protein [Tepidisphaeraceae bacterium]